MPSDADTHPPKTRHREPISEALRREHKVRRSADYLRCYRRGRRRHGDLAVLHVHPNDGDVARLGITASRKVGNAVVRQRTKRRVREIFRRSPLRQALAGLDIVVHLKPTVASADFATLRDEIERMLAGLPGSDFSARDNQRSRGRHGRRSRR